MGNLANVVLLRRSRIPWEQFRNALFGRASNWNFTANLSSSGAKSWKISLFQTLSRWYVASLVSKDINLFLIWIFFKFLDLLTFWFAIRAYLKLQFSNNWNSYSVRRCTKVFVTFELFKLICNNLQVYNTRTHLTETGFDQVRFDRLLKVRISKLSETFRLKETSLGQCTLHPFQDLSGNLHLWSNWSQWFRRTVAS